MEAACNDWVQVCPSSGLSFTHLVSLDNAPDLSTATFVVRFSPLQAGDFFAVSFFPNDPQFKRQLIVTPSYFTSAFDHVGILRHELGHILGYRHEQVQAGSACALEDGNWKPITPYDAHSVMHYMCGGGGSFSLQLTDVDKQGHRKTYGV